MGKELFDNIPSKVADLLSDVKNGRIGLPDLQRPFVWKDNKVRELLDSMMKGYPIGYIMLWASPDDYENTGYIGKNDKMYKRPDDLVIDGQQRLTALLAAMYGVTIKDKNYKERKIRISFNPLTREFAVWTQAYERNPEWIRTQKEEYEKMEKINVVIKEELFEKIGLVVEKCSAYTDDADNYVRINGAIITKEAWNENYCLKVKANLYDKDDEIIHIDYDFDVKTFIEIGY